MIDKINHENGNLIKFIVNTLKGERDILTPIKDEMLTIKDGDGVLIYNHYAPHGGWTYEELQNNHSTVFADTAEAYLGDVWVGSTEV